MSQQEQLPKAGAWFFRWRSYLPLLLFAVIIPAFEDFHYPFGSHAWDLAWEMVCLMVSMFGLAIRCHTIGRIPKGTSGRNATQQVASSLNTTGMYSITRNPLYLGNFFMTLGVVMFVRVWWVSVIYCLAFWLYYERIIQAEQSFLRGKFGEVYERYMQRVPAFIPNFRLWQPPSLPFSFRNILKREYPGVFGVIMAFTFMEILGDYVVTGRLIFDPVWMGIFGVGLVGYIVLRTLKKKTRVLHVEGR